jgi:hypothetical protein
MAFADLNWQDLNEWAGPQAENTRKLRLIGVLDGLAGKRTRILGP